MAKPSIAAEDSSSGLSLEEIKAVAAEVGLDPALIERAARLIPQGPRESRFVRLIGGPLQHRPDVHFPTKLTDERAAHLLSAVRATVEREGEGQANSSGMSWHSKRGATQFFVNANAEMDGTRVRVRLDQRGKFFGTAWFSLVASWPMASFLIDGGPSIVSVALAALPVALGSIFWASTTRGTQEKVDALMDTVSRSLTETGGQSASSEENG